MRGVSRILECPVTSRRRFPLSVAWFNQSNSEPMVFSRAARPLTALAAAVVQGWGAVGLAVWLMVVSSAAANPTNVWTAGSFNDADPNNNNHRWDNPANWAPYGVPASNAAVIINSGQPDASALGAFQQYAVYLNGGTLTGAGLVMEVLNQNGGSLANSNAIAPAGGVWNWTNGVVYGTCRVLPGATANVGGGQTRWWATALLWRSKGR